MANLFEFFPLVNYDGVKARNLMARIKVARDILQRAATFYPYTVGDGEFADQIANDYYGSPEWVWLVYLSNDIIDPYYQWPLSDNQVIERIKTLYGSEVSAYQKILYYKHVDYTHTLSPDTYKYLPAEDKVGWEAVDAFTHEMEENDKKRQIKLVSRKLLTLIENELKTVFETRVV
jgi:hypothetical protein